MQEPFKKRRMPVLFLFGLSHFIAPVARKESVLSYSKAFFEVFATLTLAFPHLRSFCCRQSEQSLLGFSDN